MNRRKITGIIAVLLSGLLLTGCVVTPPEMRDEDTGIDQVSVPKDPVKDNTETEAGPSETDPETETDTETETDPGTETTTEGSVEDSVDYESFYAPVLDEILNAIDVGLENITETHYLSTGVTERLMYAEKDELLKNLGYFITDVSGDGIPELIIGEKLSYSGDEADATEYVYAVYSCQNDEITWPIEGWARNVYSYLGDGYFYHRGSGGAMYTCYGKLHLSKDGTKVEWDEYYFSDYNSNGTDIGYYYNTTGEWDTKVSEELSITPEEFSDKMLGYEISPIKWNPIGDFK